MSFEQFAQGTMTIEVEGDWHCGPDNTSPRKFDWEVLITYPDGALDEKGFLLDNLSFEGFFNGLGKTSLSCEKLTEKCCEELWRMVEGRAEGMKVTVWAISGKVRVSKVREREGGKG